MCLHVAFMTEMVPSIVFFLSMALWKDVFEGRVHENLIDTGGAPAQACVRACVCVGLEGTKGGH